MAQGILPDEQLNATSVYADIIHLPHWQPNRKHPRMSLHDRAAQFAPFAALVGYDQMINEEIRMTDRMIDLADGQKDTLDRKLNRLNLLTANGVRPVLSITYFIPDPKKTGGRYETIKAPVRRVDSGNRKLILITREHPDLPDTIPFDRILDLAGKELPDPDDDF